MRTFLTVNSSFKQNENALNKIENKKQLNLLSCDIARSVLHVWTKQFPDDLTVPNLIQTTENYLFDLTDLEQLNIARNNAYYAAYAASYASNASNAAYAAYYTASSVYNTSYYAANALNNKEDQWNFTYNLYLQTFKPKHIIIPKLPIFIEIANEIKSTRNFKLYNVLTDAIMDYSNIKINTHCLGLSNWLLFELLVDCHF